MSCIITQGPVFQGGAAHVFARIEADDVDAPLITQDAIDSIEGKLIDLGNPPPVVAPIVGEPFDVPLSHVLDELVTGDSRWTADALGYNFEFALPEDSFPAEHVYVVQFKFFPADESAPLIVQFKCPARPTY